MVVWSSFISSLSLNLYFLFPIAGVFPKSPVSLGVSLYPTYGGAVVRSPTANIEVQRHRFHPSGQEYPSEGERIAASVIAGQFHGQWS